MGNRQTQDISYFDPLIERFDQINKKYGDNYPVIVYEPDIESEEKKILKSLIQEKNSLDAFSNFTEAFQFAQWLGISFILIVPRDYDKQHVLQNFGGLGNVYGRAMFDFEEESILKDLFGNHSYNLAETLSVKTYLFLTPIDLMIRLPFNENEEEIMVMCDIKDMASEFHQESILIWYDPCMQRKVKAIMMKTFSLQEENFYTDFEELYQRIKSSGGFSYHLIITGEKEAKTIVDEMSQLKDMLCLYIYCDNPEIKKIQNRKIFIEDTVDKLVPKITEGIRTKLKLTNSFPAFATVFDAFDQSHIYSLHYYLKGFVNFRNRKQAKRDFLRLAKNIYQSEKIFQFEQEYGTYMKSEILKWYTMESPVYKLLNNCLRIATPDSILYCRFILRDLEESIREEYQEGSHKFNGLVYRGAYISQDEWEKLQNNVGKEIEMYGFLSTSQDLKTAKNFLYSDLQNKILITIIVPPLSTPEMNKQGFAKISQNSDFKEAEILFNVRSKFRILEVGMTKINDNGKECRHLVLHYGSEYLRRSMTYSQPVISVKLKLSSGTKCGFCGASDKLFGFNQGGTKVGCIDCVIKGLIPKDTPLLALDPEIIAGERRVIEKNLKGKMLKFSQTTSFPYYGYKCHNCKEKGKEKYYKWLALNGEEIFEQCSDCFENRREVKSEMLLLETNPHVLWQEHQSKSEIMNNHYDAEVLKSKKFNHQGEIYLETQRFDLCLEYEKKFISRLKRKKWREIERQESFERIGVASHDEKHQQALQYHQEVLNIRKIIYGDETPWTAPSYSNLAIVYLALKEYQQALSYFQKAINIMRRCNEESNPYLVASYGGLASTYAGLGQFKEALTYQKKALNLKKMRFTEHPKIATSYTNLASVYSSLDQHQEALEYHQKAFEILKAIFGEKHLGVAFLFNRIASVYTKLGKYQEAFEYHKKALYIVKTLRQDSHLEAAQSYEGLALVNVHLGQYLEAAESHSKALDILKKLYGEKHPETVISYGSLAVVYEKLGRNHEAFEYQKKALDTLKSTLGDKSPQTATSYNNLALVCSNLGKFDQAIEYFKSALGITTAIFQGPHSLVAASECGLAAVYNRLGRYQEALVFATKALEGMKFVHGEQHLETSNVISLIGTVYYNLQQPEKSLEYRKKALSINQTVYGDKHPETASSYDNVGIVYQSLKKYKEALEYHKKAMNLRKDIYRDKHPDIACSYNNLASLYLNLRKTQEALEYTTKSLDLRKAIYGESHPEVALSYHNLGIVSETLGKYQDALEYHQKALEIRKKIFGDRHPDVVASSKSVEIVLRKLGQHQQTPENFYKGS